MNNTLVNQTLIEIEENLREIQSARSQVNSVSLLSQSLISSVSSVIKKIEKLERDLVEDRQNQIGKIDSDLLEFQTKLKTNADKAVKKSSEFLTKHGNEIQEHLRSVSVNLDSFKTNLDKTSKSASEKTAALIQKQGLEITNTIQELKNFQEELKKFNTKMANLDLNSSIENLKKSGEVNSNEIIKKVTLLNSELVKIKSLASDQPKVIGDQFFQIRTQIENMISLQNRNHCNTRDELMSRQDEMSENQRKSLKEIKNSNLITQTIIVIGGLMMAALIYMF